MDNGNFRVPGCHSVMYPVELPSWLDDDVVDELLICFKRHLERELQFMLAARNRAESTMSTLHHYNASQGSLESIHSYASSGATHENQIDGSGLELGARKRTK